jgi:hypothetical protein
MSTAKEIRTKAMLQVAEQNKKSASTIRRFLKDGLESREYFEGLAMAYELTAKTLRMAIRERNKPKKGKK